jgi:hypothetical protein
VDVEHALAHADNPLALMALDPASATWKLTNEGSLVSEIGTPHNLQRTFLLENQTISVLNSGGLYEVKLKRFKKNVEVAIYSNQGSLDCGFEVLFGASFDAQILKWGQEDILASSNYPVLDAVKADMGNLRNYHPTTLFQRN